MKHKFLSILMSSMALFSCNTNTSAIFDFYPEPEVMADHPAIGNLTSKQATFIRDSYYEKYGKPFLQEEYGEHYSDTFVMWYAITKDFGIFHENYLVSFTSHEPLRMVTDAYLDILINDIPVAEFPSGGYWMILCTQDGDICDPQEAYDNGLLNDEDVNTLHQKFLEERFDYHEEESKENYKGTEGIGNSLR